MMAAPLVNHSARTTPSGKRDPEPLIAVTTFQRPEVISRLREGNTVHSDGRRREREFTDAYRWMAAELATYSGRPRIRYPFWVWVRPRWTARHVCPAPAGTACGPDLCNHPLRADAGEVQIDLRVPAAELLSSDHLLWHNCLNDSYLPSEEEWSAIEAAYDADLPVGDPRAISDFEWRARTWLDLHAARPAAGRWTNGHGAVRSSVLTGELRDELRASWRRCLLSTPPDHGVGPTTIQGCVDHLAPDWVTRYRRFLPDHADHRPRLRPGPWCRLDRPDPAGHA